MTAERWWVRVAARWLARVDGVSGQLRLAMLGLTGVSTGLVALETYGLREYAIPFMALVGMGGLGFAYLYTEGGVWNQMARDRADMSTNYASPGMFMDDMLILVAVFMAVNGRPPAPEELAKFEEFMLEQWKEYRDGMPEEHLNDT